MISSRKSSSVHVMILPLTDSGGCVMRQSENLDQRLLSFRQTTQTRVLAKPGLTMPVLSIQKQA